MLYYKLIGQRDKITDKREYQLLKRNIKKRNVIADSSTFDTMGKRFTLAF